MRLLLDTHILLWALAEPKKIPKQTRAQIEVPDNEVLFSAASLWEVAIKVQTGRLTLPVCRFIIAIHSIGSWWRKPSWNLPGC